MRVRPELCVRVLAVVRLLDAVAPLAVEAAADAAVTAPAGGESRADGVRAEADGTAMGGGGTAALARVPHVSQYPSVSTVPAQPGSSHRFTVILSRGPRHLP